jgi:hypothetical protein
MRFIQHVSQEMNCMFFSLILEDNIGNLQFGVHRYQKKVASD